MRSLSLRYSSIVAGVCAVAALCAGLTQPTHAATYYLPAGFAPSYYWTGYYPTGFYGTAYYPSTAVRSPTAYYVDTNYSYPRTLSNRVLPSAYYVPTDYTPYFTTSSYIRTYDVYPTVSGTPYVPIGGPPCGGVVTAAPVRIVQPPDAARQAIPFERESREEPSGPSAGRRPIPLDREPPEEGTISSKVKSPPEAPRADQARPAAPSGPEKRGSAPAEGGKSPALEPAPKSGDQGTSRRESFRYTPDRSNPAKRNVLQGRVETNSGDPREGVRVAVSSRTGRPISRYGMSDALGNFAIGLEDGEWSAEVTMPSGRVYSVRQFSAANGRIIDNQEGREIPSLIISY
jgi:hypothetical protein